MITFLILWLIFGKKDNKHSGFDEEDDFEEMLIMGMIDDD